MTMPAKTFVLVEDARKVVEWIFENGDLVPLRVYEAAIRMDRTVSETERALEQERKSDA